MERKAISKRLETFFNEKTHWNAKKHHRHGPKNGKSAAVTPILHNFPHNPRAHILYHRLWYFIQIPYLSNFEQQFSGFCKKRKSCFIRTNSVWSRQISADHLTLIFNFNNFTHNPRAHMSCHRLWYFTQIPYLSKFRATLFGISRFCTKCKACFIRIAHRQRLRQTDLGWQPNIDLTLATLRTTYEHIFYITVFNISYRFHICQSFEQHFSGSWDFVRNVKHVFHPLILIFNYDNLTHNPWTHILYHRLWYFIQIAFETDVGKNILFGVDAENFSAQSTHSESWKFSRKLYRGTERSHMLFCWLVSRRL